MRIQLAEYVALNNTKDASSLVTTEGLPRPTSSRMLVKELNHLIKNNRKDALIKIAEIHPDRELILEAERLKKGSDKKMNACGCSYGADGENQINCAGCGGTCGGSAKLSCDGNPNCNCNKKTKLSASCHESISGKSAMSDKLMTVTLVALAAATIIVLAKR